MEELTLEPLHAFCSANPDAAVGYVHDKGSFHGGARRPGKPRTS